MTFVGASACAAPAASTRRSEPPAQQSTPPQFASSLPLVGPQGNDEDGYPRAAIDETQLIELVRARQFVTVTAIIEHLQDAFEVDYRKERWVEQAFAIFRSNNESELGPLLDEWSAAQPSSFVPMVARGMHLSFLGWSRRGKAWISDTRDDQLAEMAQMHDQAARAFLSALAIRPRALVAFNGLLYISGNASGEAKQRLYLIAEGACKDCYIFRVTHLYSLTPRWGGSYAEMENVALQAQKQSTNPKLRLLSHVALLDMADVAMLKRSPARSIEVTDRLIADRPTDDALEKRAEAHESLKNCNAAVADLDQAVSLQARPAPMLLWRRARCRIVLSDYKGAADDVLAARRATTFDDLTTDHERELIDGLAKRGQALIKVKDYDGALAAFAQGMRLDPEWPDMHDAYYYAQRRGRNSQEVVDEIEAQLAKEPDNIELYKMLDAVEHMLLHLDKRIRVWDRFLARNPNVPDARYARAKAELSFSPGDPAARQALHETAKQDLRFACEAGILNACRREKALTQGSRRPAR